MSMAPLIRFRHEDNLFKKYWICPKCRRHSFLAKTGVCQYKKCKYKDP